MVDSRPALGFVQVRRSGEVIPVSRPVANEVRMEVTVNGNRLLGVNCSTVKLVEMVTGFLWLEQVIAGPDDIETMKVCVEDRVIEVRVRGELDYAAYERRRALTSGCGGGVTFQELASARAMVRVAAGPVVPVRRLFELLADLFRDSPWYRASGGLHAAALADADDGILALCEDLGRHNAIDKIAGECLLRSIDPRGKILLSTGRMSSDMVLKAGRMQVPILASRTSPTDLSLSLAEDLGLTLVGYVRGDRCHVYSGFERIAGVVAGVTSAPHEHVSG